MQISEKLTRAERLSKDPFPIKNHDSAGPQIITPATEDNAVKISANNLSRLMGLAAESLVEARKLQSIRQGYLQLRSSYQHLVYHFESSLKSLSKQINNTTLEEPIKQTGVYANQFRQLFQDQLNVFDDFWRGNTTLSSRLYQEVLSCRMRPFSDGSQGFPRLVRNVARTLNKSVQLIITGKDTPVDRDILEKLEAPLNHILRNACDHGIESPEERLLASKPEKGVIEVNAYHKGGTLVLSIKDDGRGIDINKIKEAITRKQLISEKMVDELSDEEILEFLFLPGFSTAKKLTEISGRGVGLDVVQSMIHEIGGSVRVETKVGKGTTFHLNLPITRSVIHAILLEIDGEPYALPLSQLNRTLRLDPAQIKHLENHEYFHLEDQNIAIISAHQVLGFEIPKRLYEGEYLPVVILGEKTNAYGIIVDRVIGETELVVRPLDSRLGKVPCISAASLTEEGQPTLILDSEELIKSIDKVVSGAQPYKLFTPQLKSQTRQKKRILVVDDSHTVREAERQLLEDAGYSVETAVDGVDGYNTLSSYPFDLVVTDLDMPKMNGFDLITKIRADAKLKKTPIIVVSYKDREEDHNQAMKAGANFYLTKSSFKDRSFIDAVNGLIKKE